MEVVHCSCGHKPVIKKEFHCHGIITGTLYKFYIYCQHCKKKSKKFIGYADDADKKAAKDWLRRVNFAKSQAAKTEKA